MAFEVVGMSDADRLIWKEALGVKERIVNVSSAEILALHTTQKELIPAPGVGLYINPFDYIVEYTHGGIDYTGGGDAVMIYGTYVYAGDAIPQRRWVAWPGNIFAQTVNAIALGAVGTEIQFADGSFKTSEVVNQPLTLGLLGNSGNLVDGNGTAIVKLRYEIRALG